LSSAAATLLAARRVLQEWPLDEARLHPMPKLFRVQASQGAFALKPVQKSQGRLQFMGNLQEHVRARGFDRLGFLVPTTDGQMAAWRSGLAWTLSEWVDGQELDYGRTAEIAGAAGVLAAFHLAASDFPLAKVPGRPASNLGKWPAKIASRCGELLCACRAAAREPGSEFDRLLAAQAPLLASHSRRALFILNESGYSLRARKRRGTVPVCHGDPAAPNFIIQPNGRIYLIDLNSLRVDMQCIDLWKLLHRTGSHRQWDAKAMLRILRAYCGIRPLDEVETAVLLGLLWFPEKQWRLAHNAGRPAGCGDAAADDGEGPEDGPGPQPDAAGRPEAADRRATASLAADRRATASLAADRRAAASLAAELARAGEDLARKEACLLELERAGHGPRRASLVPEGLDRV
jgi:spore coat protein I